MEMSEKDGTGGAGRCPACRAPYDKERIVAMAANCQRLFWLRGISNFFMTFYFMQASVEYNDFVLKQIGC